MHYFAVLGSPIVHSKSPRMHNNAICALNLDALYLRYELKNGDLLKETLFKLHLSGVNITLPYKEKALQIADIKDEMALNIGSANTLLIKEHKIHAFNTDGIGFLKAIEDFKGIQSALILGAGGTAKALAFVLAQKGIKVAVANRGKERLESFQKSLNKGLKYDFFTYESLKSALDTNLNSNSNLNLNPNHSNPTLNPTPLKFDLIINTTSAGLKDEDLPCERALLSTLLTNAKYAFDVIYGKQTPFLKLCANLNIPHKDGLDMLLWQGVYAFLLFFNLSKDKETTIHSAMHEALNLK